VTTVFLDCETLGLDRRAPIWEFAAIRCSASAELPPVHFTIRHDPGDWLETLPASFAADYRDRYDPASAFSPQEASLWIADVVGAGPPLSTLEADMRAGVVGDAPVIAGSNPAFDMERLTDLLQANGFEPGWHYHPCDVPTLAAGWLAARGKLFPRPWKSDYLSAAAGINPALYQRHTALGDVLWTRDLYEKITGGIW